jgi:two-component system, cell cycle sensor histidine kinase and response regulator CckA
VSAARSTAARPRPTTDLVLRRLLLLAVALPLVVGALRLAGERAGLYSSTVGVAIMVAFMIAGAVGLVAWTAASLARIDDDRLRADEASELVETFFENAPIGVAIVAPDGRWLRVNPALADLVGYTRDELLAKTYHEITHPDDLDADHGLAQQVLAGELETFQLEKRYIHKSGRTIWIQLSVSIVCDAAGEPLYFVSQVEGIDERKAAEEALRRSQARLAEAQKLARLGSWEWRAEDDVVAWSDELYRIFGIEPGEVALTYGTYLARLHPDDRAPVEETIGRSAETGEPFVVEHRVIRPDGEVRWVQGHGEVVDGGAGLVMLGTAQDITEQRGAEQRLREAEERYRQLVEHLPLVTYIRPLDLHAGNVYCSPQVEAMLGYSAETWRNDPDLIARTAHPDDLERIYALSEQVRATGKPQRGEYRFVKPDGEVVWVQDETYLLHDEQGRPTSVSGYLLDITDRKRAEAERDRLQAEVLHAQKLEAVGQLAGGVAHEFNNVLMAIRGHTELLLERLPASGAEHADMRQILGAAERATTLTRQLLAFGRKQVLNARHVDLGEAAAGAVELLRPLIQPRISLAVAAEAGLPAAIADPAQVEQVLVNLILNARDAIVDRGEISLTATVAQVDHADLGSEQVEPGLYAGITVADTGSGMTEEIRARMFEPFFTTKEVGEGSGLGLSTVYGIVRQGGGFIDVVTEPGLGTSITAYLPAVAAAGAAPPPGPKAELSVPPSPGRVLVVDDEDSVREVCAAMLGRLGYQVETAHDGEEALALLDEGAHRFRLLLTDVVMPGITGWALAERVRTLAPETAVVFMSGYPGEQRRGRAPDSARLLQKPFTLADLRAVLDERAAALAYDTVGG